MAAGSYPLNYAILYGATLPLMLLAAVLANCYVVPLPAVEVQREPFLKGIFGGFGRFLSNRLIVVACIAFLLVASGIMIQNNMVFFTREVGWIGRGRLRRIPERPAIRVQSARRSGAGLDPQTHQSAYEPLRDHAVGHRRRRVDPRAPSGCFGPSLLFMVAFGLNGAGELMGHYYPYYVFCLSPKSQMRRNIALVTLINMPVAFSPALFGLISDRWNLTASFWAALAMMVVALVLVAGVLPARPRPRAEDLEAADLEEERL